MNSSKKPVRRRNTLHHDERLRVIKEFELTPCYQKLARKFNCCAQQIKSIIIEHKINLNSTARKEEEYSSNKQININADQMERENKILFLEKVLYEYILRSVYNGYELTELLVQLKAMEISEATAIDDFKPSEAWLYNFKLKYDIPNVSFKELSCQFIITEPKNCELEVFTLMEYVINAEKEAKFQAKEDELKLKAHANKEKKSKQITQSNGDCIIDLISDDDDYDESETSINMYPYPAVSSVFSSSSTIAGLSAVISFPQALKHLQSLEEYAMLKSNFRAIELLSQLEKVLQEEPQEMDFQ